MQEEPDPYALPTREFDSACLLCVPVYGHLGDSVDLWLHRNRTNGDALRSRMGARGIASWYGNPAGRGDHEWDATEIVSTFHERGNLDNAFQSTHPLPEDEAAC